MSATVRRSFWSLSRREVRAHATVLALVLWIGAAVLMFATPGHVDVLGQLKGTDFVHFYTLGRAATSGQSETLYDRDALHGLQADLVPDSAPDLFEPVYPPQTALLFAPLARLPYLVALVVWSVATAFVYGLSVWAARRRWPDALPDRRLVAMAALGFPPFWNLILHGQTTLVPLLAFLLGWLALERRRPLAAGLALGLLAVKPQFGLVLAVVVLVGGEWAMLAGAIISVGVQAALAGSWLGGGVLVDYVEILWGLPELASALEPRPYQLHSIRVVTDLLPGWAGSVAWVGAAGLVMWQTVRVWRSGAPIAARYAAVVLASVLVSPHLTIYDASVLVLPLILLGGWLEASELVDSAHRYWLSVYGLVVSFVVPFALVLSLQVSVFLLAWIFYVATQPQLRR